MHNSGIILIVTLIGLGIQLPRVLCFKKQDAVTYCTARSGLRSSDIQDVAVRNEGCAIDCITKQGIVQTYFMQHTMSCGAKDDHRCILGKCRQDDYVPTYTDLYNIELRVLSAFVEDKDQGPFNGESDVFVVINVIRGAGPAYEDTDDVCHTYVIQDNSRPKWNFVCRPMPMQNSTLLRFVAIDSDKPLEAGDQLGTAIESLDRMMNKGPVKLPLLFGANAKRPYYLEVEVKGTPYNPSVPKAEN